MHLHILCFIQKWQSIDAADSVGSSWTSGPGCAPGGKDDCLIYQWQKLHSYDTQQRLFALRI